LANLTKGTVLKHAIDVHRGIFNILYDRDTEIDPRLSHKAKVELLADIIVHSSLYCMLDVARDKIEQFLLSLPVLWKDISQEPHFYLGIGYHLKSEAIFIDAMKHAVGGGILDRDIYSTSIYFSNEAYIIGNHLCQILSKSISDCIQS
jgi:hypothetical protein